MSTDLVIADKSEGRDLQTNYATQQRAMIEGAIIVAQKIKRNVEHVEGEMMKSCWVASFASDSTYKFPRGGKDITGPSVVFARELARVWGNVQFGADVIADDEESRTLRCWAWDVQTNFRTSADVCFRKLIYRKKGGWVKPDERDLRELNNRQAALTVRNCILELFPVWLVERCLAAAEETDRRQIASDTSVADKLVEAFGKLNVDVEKLELFMGNEIAKATPTQIQALRQIYSSIRDGNSTPDEYFSKPKSEASFADTPTVNEMIQEVSDVDKWKAETEGAVKRARSVDGIARAINESEKSCPVELEIVQAWLTGIQNARREEIQSSTQPAPKKSPDLFKEEKDAAK